MRLILIRPIFVELKKKAKFLPCALISRDHMNRDSANGVCRAGRLWLRGAQRGPRLRQRGRHELASLRPKALGEKELEGENPAMFGGNVERCVY